MPPCEEDIPQQSTVRWKGVSAGTAGKRWIHRELNVRRLNVKGSKGRITGWGKRQR